MPILEIYFNKYVNIRRIILFSKKKTFGKCSFKWYVDSAVFMKS
jgi:hypothetical protein